MAKELNLIKSAQSDRRDQFSVEESVSGSNVFGEWFFHPAGAELVNFDFKLNGASNFRIEATGESRDRVTKNLASGLPWAPGDVSVRTQQASKGFTAYRLFVTSGDVTMYMSGQ